MNLYLLFKSLHIIAVISWMAGLLYLPRIFVYHAETTEASQSKVFKVMERKLYKYIMLPAMILSWLFGLLLIHSLGFQIFSELWVQIKIAAVLILTYYHFYLGRLLHLFATDSNSKSSKFFRIINEIPTILLIVIVFVVVFKPLNYS
ncbi:MAG: protoporphyrinogen oxidase HemJ [Candidatus Pelagibacter sp. TMED272]|nr:TIGR00701 family protein [Pelagibacteraceae bacterium]RPG93573.1 MAG: protoporphyrinogen oxidase HemJ [Candidatus Pelagibacter sp. TMED272]